MMTRRPLLRPLAKTPVLLAWVVQTSTGQHVTYQATSAESARRIAEAEGHVVTRTFRE
jgi:hypothetical protein